MFKVDRFCFGMVGIFLLMLKFLMIIGIEYVRNFGLDVMEFEFVRGVNIFLELVKKIKYVVKKNDVFLIVYVLYYINFNVKEKVKVEVSKKRIIQSVERFYEVGGWSVVFYVGYYFKQLLESVYQRIFEVFKDIQKELMDKGVKVWIRLELIGKFIQFGDLKEIVKFSEEFEMVFLMIDFVYVYVRNRGKCNSVEEWCEMLFFIEDRFGREVLDNMYIYMSGIEYIDKGEKRYLFFQESDMNWEDLFRVLKEFRVKGVVISESLNIEEDVFFMKKKYEEIKV